MKTDVLIVAGEASSCLYAQRLLELWQRQGLPVNAFGIGNAEMVSLGFEALGRAEEMAVVGLQEVISHWSVISGAFHRVVEAARQRRPCCALLLDYPDFNLRLAAKLKGLQIPVVYYISPQLWAWRKGRIKQIKKLVDQMLVVFPFEKSFYESHQVPVEFVGHPLLDEVDSGHLDPKLRLFHRRRFGIADDDICLGLMPGSRRSELKHHLQTQVETAGLLHKKNASIRPAILVAPTLTPEMIQAQLPDYNLPLKVIQTSPFQMIQLADVILCASGTATLMVGLMQTPMVIMYKMNAITARFAKLLVRSTPYFGMVNLISQQKIVPEFFQAEANPARLAEEVGTIVENPQTRQQMVEQLGELRSKLGERGATERVAKALAGYFQ